VLVALVVLVALLGAQPLFAQTQADDKPPAPAVEEKLSEIRAGLAKHERIATEGEQKASKLLEDINKLDTRMLSSARRLDSLQAEEAALAEEHGARVRKLEGFEQERAAAEALLVKRLSSIYKRGRLGSNRALAQAATSTQPLRMARYLAAISQADKRAFKDFEDARVRHRDELQTVEEKHRRVGAKTQALAVEKQRYQSARKAKQALLTSIEKDIKASMVERERLAAVENELQRIIVASTREPEPATTGEPRSLVARLFGPRSDTKPFDELKGALAAPVKGQLLARYGSQDEGGPRSKGVLIKAGGDRQVATVGEGEVVFSGPFPGLGNTLIINHGGRYHSVYAHLGSIHHEVGEKVAQYEILGSLAPGDPTLHFEIRAEGKAVDPEPWFVGGYAAFNR
jgi:septal ring factor EnvC (AmiA/AmiB activator)